MSQLYLSRTPSAQPADMQAEVAEKSVRKEDKQSAFLEQKDRLLTAIDTAKSILNDLRIFNKESWVRRLPMHPQAKPAAKSMRRSLSFADDPTFQADVVVQPARKGMARSVTLAAIPDEREESLPQEEEEDRLIPSSDAHDFHLFKLDLKLGAHGSSTAPASLVSQLEKASIANLLDDRIGASMNHIDKLRLRVDDTSSKVLVTGDLNAGKSTFVNALLRREVMPVDQQPCTTAFCEVHDAAEIGGKEELHVLKDGVTYSKDDESTFTRAELSELDSIVSENEDVQKILKIYLADGRSPEESLLSNGVVDISLIDAPGLNRDSIKTTALFARQEEIDVVVFVVSAENHFTLSAKEFLWNASNEKAYLFIVVNKYEQIRDKAKCRRLILEQIKQLSPRTYGDAEDLVHFVDSSAAMESGSSSFSNLESELRSFVLVKRAKSKLTPASTYLTHLLSDVDLLVGANAIVAQTEFERAREDLEKSRPILEKMQSGREAFDESLEGIEDAGASRTRMHTKEILADALTRVGQGKLGITKPGLSLPAYPGIFGIWEYASEVRRALLASLDMAVEFAQDEARITTTAGVNRVTALGEEHLPEGVERSRRVFMPEAMFSVRAGEKKGRRKSGRGTAVVAGGIYGLGIGLAQRPDMLETTFFDLFDVQHQFWVHFGDKTHQDEDPGLTALSVASVGLGALTMVGGKTLGARGLIEGLVRVTDLFGNETARKWAAPVLGAITIGAAVYYILELPSTIPKTVGRRIQAALIKEHEEHEEETFVEAHSLRVSRETRKVLRLASWDLKERFRAAMNERTKEVKGAEEMEKKAQKAVEWFAEVQQRTAVVRENAELASLA
ncbi:mitofusin [Steccherinum ochraceum]|uniref:Mitofusin n=1 Tax=Steccherinum ochraceum TaxID=92696 RepID=A0A4R0RGE8_9APHY|nr:mitofusin [Steccherinum ochraceum]